MNRFTTMPRTRGSNAGDVLALLLTLGVLAACTSYGPGDLGPGRSEAEVRDKMGEPTGRYALPDGGSKIEYARGPAGGHTYMVDVDAAGRVRGVEQVLTERNFNAVQIGTPRDDVRRRLGRPSESRVGWRGVGEVWSYRFEWTAHCRWFQIWFVDGTAREAAFATDPMCEERRRD